MNYLSLAGGLLFLIWCSIVIVVIGAWAMKTIDGDDNDIEGLK